MRGQILLAVQTMYFVDTYKSCIWEFRTDDRGAPVKNGSGAYEKREIVKVPQEEGIPDGMTIDRQVIPLQLAPLPAAGGHQKMHRRTRWAIGRALAPQDPLPGSSGRRGFPVCRMMNLWVALADGGAVASYNPVSGKQLAKVGFCGQFSH